jgi:Fur family transcriptional regulator, iron response regulator
MQKLRHPMNQEALLNKLRRSGLRPTPQRLAIGKLLFDRGNRHVTAESLQEEAKTNDCKVSLATIYNTLHQFTEAGLLRQIIVDPTRAYFDTNTTSHHHFFHEDTLVLEDIPGERVTVQIDGRNPFSATAPAGKKITEVGVIIRISSE